MENEKQLKFWRTSQSRCRASAVVTADEDEAPSRISNCMKKRKRFRVPRRDSRETQCNANKLMKIDVTHTHTRDRASERSGARALVSFSIDPYACARLARSYQLFINSKKMPTQDNGIAMCVWVSACRWNVECWRWQRDTHLFLKCATPRRTFGPTIFRF